MAEPFRVLLEAVVANAEQPVSRLPLLTQADLLARLPIASAYILLCLDREWDMIAGARMAPATARVTAANLACILYISGSTGTPKGVLIQRQDLCNPVQAQQQAFDGQASSRVLQFALLNCDASIWKIVMALCSGAILYLGTTKSLVAMTTSLHWVRFNSECSDGRLRMRARQSAPF
jgi:non-ribosomal peptide synthetase component F